MLISVVAMVLCCGLLMAMASGTPRATPWMLDMSGLLPAAQAQLGTINSARFEGGNLGTIERVSPHQYQLHLRSDNDDALPPAWRQWWYAKMENVPTDRPVEFVIKGHGFRNLYVPAYSYDNVRWQLFDERDVSKGSDFDLRLRKRFTQASVYVARYIPYTYSKLLGWLDGLKKRRGVKLSKLGTTEMGREIPYLTITEQSARISSKSRVLVHARTHPGEVGSNFLLEGFVDYLLSSDAMAQRMRRRLIVEIIPMLNVDGVVVGNNRVTPGGLNLEGKWFAHPRHTLLLDTARVPKEVRLLHARYASLAQEPTPITVALNLHSSAGQPEDQMFFFPHFGPRERGYQEAEAALYKKQLRFIDLWRRIQGPSWFNAPPVEGESHFLAKDVPESWWWRNFQDRVMAISVESVYGRAGRFSQRWVTPQDMRRLGRSLAQALARYHGL